MVAALEIRAIRESDAEAVTEIYAEQVANGIATFDTETPSVDAMRQKIASIVASGWPFIAATRSGTLIGYAYAAQFRDRKAYAATCENSIYIAQDCRGQGIGKQLLVALIEASERCGFRQMIAVISEPASISFHAGFGFRQIGQMQSVGRKFGRWLDVYFMQREIGDGDRTPPGGE
jgi:L-amino acid N-acyltransferase YncA